MPSYKFNPFTGELDLVGSSSGAAGSVVIPDTLGNKWRVTADSSGRTILSTTVEPLSSGGGTRTVAQFLTDAGAATTYTGSNARPAALTTDTDWYLCKHVRSGQNVTTTRTTGSWSLRATYTYT